MDPNAWIPTHDPLVNPEQDCYICGPDFLVLRNLKGVIKNHVNCYYICTLIF